MADNVAITAGSGTTVATDDVTDAGGAHYQKIKIADGAANSTAMIGGDATNGLDVDVTRVGGDVTVIGKAADGAAVAGNPVLVAGQDGTNVQSIKTDTNGELQVDVLTLPNVTIGTNAALVAGTAAIGDVGGVARASGGGLTSYHLVSANTTNATVVKASAGQLYGWYIYNNNTSMRKLAFHNASTTPTAGASIYFTVNLPGSSAANVMMPVGITFGTGIAFTTVTDVTDAGTTAVGTSDLTINLWYA